MRHIMITLDNNNYEWIRKIAYKHGRTLDAEISECIERRRESFRDLMRYEKGILKERSNNKKDSKI